MTCEKVFDVSVFHFTLCDAGRGTSTACTTWDSCAARAPVGHVDTVERADLVPIPLQVVIPLKIASESEWIVVVDGYELGEEGRTDRQARSSDNHSAGTRGRED